MPSLLLAIQCVYAPLAQIGPLKPSLVVIQRREKFPNTVIIKGSHLEMELLK